MGKNNRRPSSFQKNIRPQFDRRGSFKKSKRQNPNFDRGGSEFNPDETVYRILCPVKKIGSVIGKGGDIIKALRDETHAKIKVGDSVPGTDERVVIIFSSSAKKPKIHDSIENQEPPAEDNQEPPADDNQDPPAANNQDPPAENNQEPPAENNQEPPAENNQEPHAENNQEPPAENNQEPPAENNQEPPAENNQEPPAENNQEPPKNEYPTEEEHDPMEPLCPAQHALLKVHERIAEDDGLFGGPVHEGNNEEDVVTARLLVPSNQVGCLLGKGGHVIQKLRTETGASIRILPEDRLPACAMSTDELVQISGVSATAKKALYAISALLHQNPRPQMSTSIPDGSQSYYPPAAPIGNMPSQRHPMSHRNSGFRGPQPMPWESELPRPPSGNSPAEFSMKILCPSDRIGVVIGKGGSKVRQIQQETGTNIHVEDTTPEAEERAILVSSFDAPWNPISPTIEAILQLQVRTNVISEEGTITTRLLVPSSKVGCLLGQGGHVINEMRRRTRADIRVISKDGKPNYAAADEELVQVSGNVNVARDALTEISSRLRMRSLEGAVEPGPVGPFQGFGRPESFAERRLPPPGIVGGRTSGGYERVKGGGHEFEARRYPSQPTPSRFPDFNSSMQVKIPNSAISSVLGSGGSNISNIGQMSGAKVKLNDPQAGGSECIVEIHGSSEQMNAAQNLLQTYISSSVQNFNAHQSQVPHGSAVQNFNSQLQPSPYASARQSSNLHQQQNPYASSAQNYNAQQNQSPYGSAMPSLNTQQYQTSYASTVQSFTAQQQQQQSPYASAAPSFNSYQQQQQSPYTSAVQNYSAQQPEQSSYAPASQNFDGQQQQGSYQY
ncbi:hypothetical protein AQUCO_02600290v1 [Aquilegia coerulea]|uniref:K Homology domain-containing protein n=1 Tax=Aquilegia coerulea TaxID=218851 RepID=A0A2G5D8A3_AQUCA|nr:hypothetical protein AQUCO_02600290v1 [Aquilegia coerulea]